LDRHPYWLFQLAAIGNGMLLQKRFDSLSAGLILLLASCALALWFLPKNDMPVHIGAVFFALFCLFGDVEAWDAYTGSSQAYYLCAVGIAWFFLWQIILTAAFWTLDHLPRHSLKPRKAKAWIFLPAATAIGFIAYLPYFLANYPGLVNADPWWQINQALNIARLNNWLSLFHTCIIKICYIVGYGLFHTPNAGIAAYSVFSMLCMAFCFAWILLVFYRRGVSWIWIILLGIFYYLIPYNGLYAITMWKDVLFGLAFVAFTVLIWQAEKQKKWSKGTIIMLFVLASFICLLRSNGIYVMLFALVFFLIVWKGHRKSIIVISVATILPIWFFAVPFTKHYKVLPVDDIESFSVPIQQIAYVVTNNGTLSDDDLAAIRQFAEPEWISGTYVEYYADPMKDLIRNSGNASYLTDHESEYFHVWLHIGMENPVMYLKAYALQTRGYWYHPTQYYWKYLYGMKDNSVGYYTDPKLPAAAAEAIDYAADVFDQDIYSNLWSIGLSDWCMLGLMLYAMHRKRRNWIIYTPSLGIMLTLMLATPVAYEFRYAYGIFLALPAMACMNGIDTANEQAAKKDSQAE
jgi:hypothetical protein